ncbi:MAG: agmatinase family protein [Chromatiales bacterium]|nr:agmatinase family protein [Chromatiales bacterium]
MPQQLTLQQTINELEQGNPPASDAGFLGASLDPAEATLLLIPVPWEATTSYGGGTSAAPQAIISASHQLDLEDSAFGQPYRAGITFIEQSSEIESLNAETRQAALKVIEALERNEAAITESTMVNAASEQLNHYVYQQAKAIRQEGKLAAVVGGDHASPQGLIQALAEESEFGILHLDAHHDLRVSYEGFTHSHASIFYNVLENYPSVTKLVQVAIRDYSRDEANYARANSGRIAVHYGADLFARKANGESFHQVARSIVDELPERVYISFDIDALDPPYCPGTGTPVPGGLSYDEACYLLEIVAKSGREIIGFDLCEVSPGEGEWDANVGARILYKLCGALLLSHQ